MNHRLFAPLCLLALALGVGHAAETSDDPLITSWKFESSRVYARLYTSTAAQAAGTSVTTWSRGQGSQTTPTYAGVQAISYSDTWVYLRSSGLGYHVMGPWYLNEAKTSNFPNFPANTGVLYRFPRTPTVPSTKTATNTGSIGYFVDGVAMFDYTDTFSYSTSNSADASPVAGFAGRGDGVWNRDAYVNEGVTFDPGYAHQAGAQYHYHAQPPALRYLLGDHVDYDETTRTYGESATTATKHSPILGWARDGYPVYGPYGYSDATDASSGIRRMISGYIKRDGTMGSTNLAVTGRTTLPAWAAVAQSRSATLSSNVYGPAVSSTYVLGHYLEDYAYLGNLGGVQGTDYDLDLYNGRFAVTPEYPQGTYAYFMSIEADGTPKYPYIIGRWFYGSPTGAAVTSISETVTSYEKGGQAAAIKVTATTSGDQVNVSWTSVEGGTYQVESSSDGSVYSVLATGITSDGLTTAYGTSTVANYYRVTLTALATYDTDGTGGATGLNGFGSATYTVGISGVARLINISGRVLTGGSGEVPIAGFTIKGEASKTVLVRGIGPTLARLYVDTPLADPGLNLYSGQSVIASNEDWLSADADTFAATGAFSLDSGSADAALVATLDAGSYTAHVLPKGGEGVALVEVYDADASDETTLVNLSTRAYVGTGEQVLIPGFVIGGEGSLRLLLRAIGPTLAEHDVDGVVADPQITLRSGDTVIATNDNWGDSSDAGAIAAAATLTGAFALGADSKDAVILTDLSAGSYTAQISGIGDTTGNALFELYVVP